MDRENSLDLVRALTRQFVELADPQRLDTFAEDFTAFALTMGVPQVQEKREALRLANPGLDTTLVAGMFFNVLREAAHLPADTAARVSFVRKEAKQYLVTRLAGQISMSQFYRLLNLIEENVTQYFQSLETAWIGGRVEPADEPGRSPAAPPPPVREEELRRALGLLPLPQKGRRKLTPEGLQQFFQDSAGRWFRLLDFESRFQVNKKTAWSCLNLLFREGILEHNGEKANRVRYILAGRFRTTPGSR